MAAHEPFEFDVTEWFNSDPLTVEDLHGRVVLAPAASITPSPRRSGCTGW